MIIKAPNPITGLHVSLQFQDGVAHTDAPWLIQWFAEHGYQLEEEANPEPPEEEANPEPPEEEANPEPPEEDKNAGRAKGRNCKDHIAV